MKCSCGSGQLYVSWVVGPCVRFARTDVCEVILSLKETRWSDGLKISSPNFHDLGLHFFVFMFLNGQKNDKYANPQWNTYGSCRLSTESHASIQQISKCSKSGTGGSPQKWGTFKVPWFLVIFQACFKAQCGTPPHHGKVLHPGCPPAILRPWSKSCQGPQRSAMENCDENNSKPSPILPEMVIHGWLQTLKIWLVYDCFTGTKVSRV